VLTSTRIRSLVRVGDFGVWPPAPGSVLYASLWSLRPDIMDGTLSLQNSALNTFHLTAQG
jgi:hypothetical protein